jgi:hypothetical protein
MRYMIAEKELGLFLGTHINSIISDKGKMFVIFAGTDIFGISKATSFDTQEDAQLYIDDFLSKRYDNLVVLPINAKEKFISVIDVIKAGYEQYTHSMMDNIPMYSEEIH